MAEAKATGKPIMAIAHSMGCGACRALKPQVAASDEIKELSRHFALVVDDGPTASQGSHLTMRLTCRVSYQSNYCHKSSPLTIQWATRLA